VGREFEITNEMTVDASLEEIWQAIATGPGITSWFMGRNEVEPGVGGVVRTAFGGYTPELTITAWEPLKRFAYQSDKAADGRFVAYEFQIEARAGGGATLRLVTSGFLPGDDWEDEYEAMMQGGEMFFHTLGAYLTYFAGRSATPITVFGPPVSDWQRAWATLDAALGLSVGMVAAGDAVRFTPEGLPPIEGVVYFVNAQTLGVRTNDALYRFLRGIQGVMVAGHHLFTENVDQQENEQAWQAWLDRLFS
jgi:uncharacterized protein YndB with AHSA1/START domain